MLGQGSSEINHLGHIVARERTKPFIHVVGRSLIAPETHYGEVRLHQSGLDVRHTYGSIHQIYTQTVRQGLYRRLAGTVHAPAGISIVSGNGPHVNDVSPAPLHHAGHHEARHGQEGFHVRVYHHVPLVEASFMFLVHPDDQAGIVHQHVYGLPLFGKGIQGSTGCGTVAHVERQQPYFDPIFFFQFVLYGIQFLHVTAIQNQPVSVHGELAGASLSYSRGSAGYQYCLLFHCPIFLLRYV